MKKFVLTLIGCLYIASAVNADQDNEGTDIQTIRRHMVQTTIAERGISDRRVLAAMQAVPRHRFVPNRLFSVAYADRPLPIGEGQTISQPYVVALMSEILELSPGERVLEIGTGSGYQAAVLGELTDHVYSIEIKKKLYSRASKILNLLDYKNIKNPPRRWIFRLAAGSAL